MRKFFSQDDSDYEFHVEDEGKLWDLVRELEKTEEPKEIKEKVTKLKFCEICKKSFRSKYHLNLHMPVHTGEKNFDCTICKKSYQQKWNLITHMDRVHAKEKPFKCTDCGKSFGYSSHFKRHIKTHFVQKMEVSDEMKRKILNPFNCKLCPKSFDSNYRLRLHTEKHTGHSQYVCDKCGLSFRTKKMINNHLPEHENLESQCEKLFEDRLSTCFRPGKVEELPESTEVEITESNGDESHPPQGKDMNPCEVRGEIMMRESMKEHLDTHCGNGVYGCRYCDEEILESGQRTIDDQNPTGEMPYLCDFCGKGHSQYGNLLTHLLTNHTTTEDCESQSYDMSKFVPILYVPNREDADVDNGIASSDFEFNDQIALPYGTQSTDETPEESGEIPFTWINDKIAETENVKNFSEYIPGTRRTCTVTKNETADKDDLPVSKSAVLLKEKSDLMEEVRRRMNCKIFEKIVEDLSKSFVTARVRAVIENIKNSSTEDKDPLKEFLKLRKHVPVNTVVRQVDEKVQWFCWICNSVFSNRHMLARHLIIHEPEEARPFKCDQCQKTFTQSNNYKEHLMSHNNENQFYCEKCGSGFRHKSHFNNHLKRHSETPQLEKPRRFECPYCEKKFPTNFHKAEHMRTHTGEKPFKCKICASQFSTLSILKRHTVTHANARFQCQICLKLFRQKHGLKRHEAVHTEDYGKSITCECGKSFSQKSSLAKHKIICKSRDKPVAKPFDCSLCHKRFLTKSDLKRHSATHDKSKKFKCDVCSVSLKTGETYLRHIRRHKKNTVTENRSH